MKRTVMTMKRINLTILVGGFLSSVVGCSTLAPPADLAQVQKLAKDTQAMEEAKQAAPEPFEAAMMHRGRAEEACADADKEQCEHHATLAKIKLATAMEHAARIRAEKRIAVAEASKKKTSEQIAENEKQLANTNQHITRMEKLAALQTKLAAASNAAEAEKTRAKIAAEKARLEAEKVAEQKKQLDVIESQKKLFDEAVAIVGAENVKRTKRGIVVTLRGLFASGKEEVLEEKSELVARIGELAKKYSTYPLMIEGYTDTRGRSSANLALSQARAQAVMNQMTNQGVPMTRLRAAGLGPKNPVAPNSTREGRAKNRRIEIIFAITG